jgi:hypothetical protein
MEPQDLWPCSTRTVKIKVKVKVNVKVKVKQSHYRLGVAQRVPGS